MRRHRGDTFCPPHEFAELLAKLDARGFQCFVHATGDRGIRTVLDAVEHARSLNGPRDARPGRRYAATPLRPRDRYANFLEADRGSLTVGKLADFVVLTRDILRADPQAPVPTYLPRSGPHRTRTTRRDRDILPENKVAVLYGAGGPIGGAVARAFAREGARVHIAGRTAKTPTSTASP
ncbi:hypothetical protein AB0O76_40400 [Streptomyces sp. NPDC086554]|uniref:hypothetical protein n=1 Tax=Streptomyces sp. NPDC086554 TaxID=3154864 RepID=UPI003448E7D5